MAKLTTYGIVLLILSIIMLITCIVCAVMRGQVMKMKADLLATYPQLNK